MMLQETADGLFVAVNVSDGALQQQQHHQQQQLQIQQQQYQQQQHQFLTDKWYQQQQQQQKVLCSFSAEQRRLEKLELFLAAEHQGVVQRHYALDQRERQLLVESQRLQHYDQSLQLREQAVLQLERLLKKRCPRRSRTDIGEHVMTDGFSSYSSSVGHDDKQEDNVVAKETDSVFQQQNSIAEQAIDDVITTAKYTVVATEPTSSQASQVNQHVQEEKEEEEEEEEDQTAVVLETKEQHDVTAVSTSQLLATTDNTNQEPYQEEEECIIPGTTIHRLAQQDDAVEPTEPKELVVKNPEQANPSPNTFVENHTTETKQEEEEEDNDTVIDATVREDSTPDSEQEAKLNVDVSTVKNETIPESDEQEANLDIDVSSFKNETTPESDEQEAKLDNVSAVKNEAQQMTLLHTPLWSDVVKRDDDVFYSEANKTTPSDDFTIVRKVSRKRSNKRRRRNKRIPTRSDTINSHQGEQQHATNLFGALRKETNSDVGTPATATTCPSTATNKNKIKNKHKKNKKNNKRKKKKNEPPTACDEDGDDDAFFLNLAKQNEQEANDDDEEQKEEVSHESRHVRNLASVTTMSDALELTSTLVTLAKTRVPTASTTLAQDIARLDRVFEKLSRYVCTAGGTCLVARPCTAPNLSKAIVKNIQKGALKLISLVHKITLFDLLTSKTSYSVRLRVNLLTGQVIKNLQHVVDNASDLIVAGMYSSELNHTLHLHKNCLQSAVDLFKHYETDTNKKKLVLFTWDASHCKLGGADACPVVFLAKHGEPDTDRQRFRVGLFQAMWHNLNLSPPTKGMHEARLLAGVVL
jgi:hypothetical protein